MCPRLSNLSDNRWSPKEMFWLSVFAVNQNRTPGLACRASVILRVFFFWLKILLDVNFLCKAIFNWISKVIRGWIGFTLLCHLIASENHPHPDAQPKPIVTWSFAFSCASDSFGCLNSHWLLALFPLFKLAVVITLRNSTYSGWLVLYILP